MGNELIFLVGFLCGGSFVFCGMLLVEKILNRIGIK